MIVLLAAGLVGCRGGGTLTSRISRAVNRGTDYLAERQDSDGAWRSQVYKDMSDGVSLTPTVGKAMLFGGTTQVASSAARTACRYMADQINPVGGPKQTMIYPIYTASSTVIMLSRAGPEYDDSVKAWMEVLRERQLVEATGWFPDDPQYGGWGYASGLPYKPAEGQPWNQLGDSNLSSTLFAVGALRVGGAPPKDPALQSALKFVFRCQNFESEDPSFDDGGFYMSPTYGLQNKAGEAGKDRRGKMRYRSYGSATADGLRAMLRCGMAPDHPRVMAARRWLEKNFEANRMPGTFPAYAEVERASLYFYWCWSFSHAVTELERDGSKLNVDWAEPMAQQLLHLQLDNGSWVNAASASREDDPLVATPFALAALTFCRVKLVQKAQQELKETPTPAGTP